MPPLPVLHRNFEARTVMLIALVLTHLTGAGCMTALLVNDAQHMTLERATTPREPKRFRVVDAETQRPVRSARLVAVHDFDWMSDWSIKGTTDAEGMVTLRLSKDYLQGVKVHVYADGYLDRHDLLPGRAPGTGGLDDDPIDILLYREPEAGVGWRFPEEFRGAVIVGLSARQDFGTTVLVGAAEPADQAFRVPPEFPTGQRIWWSEVEPGRANTVAVPPRLGDVGRNTYPIPQAVTVGGQPVPVPEPGADVDGLAAWHIGAYMPDGPWGGRYSVLVIGNRAAALEKARDILDAHGGNGTAAYIFNGWLRSISPKTKVIGPSYGVTGTK